MNGSSPHQVEKRVELSALLTSLKVHNFRRSASSDLAWGVLILGEDLGFKCEECVFWILGNVCFQKPAFKLKVSGSLENHTHIQQWRNEV